MGGFERILGRGPEQSLMIMSTWVMDQWPCSQLGKVLERGGSEGEMEWTAAITGSLGKVLGYLTCSRSGSGRPPSCLQGACVRWGP